MRPEKTLLDLATSRPELRAFLRGHKTSLATEPTGATYSMQNVIGLLKNITAITERRRSTLELFWQQTNGLIDALSQRRGAGVSGNRCRSRRFRRLGAQELEPRALLATFTVTNTNDSGTGSLRWAFDQADASSSADTIDFSSFFANTGRVIHLTSASVNLNSGTGTTTINGPGPNFLAIQNDVDLTDVYGDTHALTVHGSSMVLNNVSILNSGGGYRLSGGAISAGNSNITVNNCWLQSNSATNFGSGGAIYSGGSGSLTITDSLLANNQAYFDGGCVAVSGGVALTISGSSLYGNSAFGYGGGGVMFYGTSSATIVNTTLSGNRGYGGGGGIRVEATGTVTIRDSTIANNSAYQGAFNQPYGGGIYVRAGTVQLSNTLLAGNGIGPEPSDVTGTITSLGNNGISTTAGATGFSNADLRNVNLNIGALQVTTQNGRWQAYHPLLSGSPALNAGTSHGTTDQRGFLRQSGSAQDIGSVEMQYPTQILLSSASVAEVVGTTSGVLAIGTLSATDADSNSHTFSMASGTGSTDNNRFEISGTTLRIKQGQTLDHELTPTLSVRIRATDANGLFFERVFSITVTNVNESPTDLNLSSSLISSHPTPQMVIGTFSTVDPDFGDTFTYSFVSGTGATDNNAFLTSGNQLKPNPTYDFTTKNSYSIRLKTMDPAGLSIEKVFTITVDDISPNVSTTSFLSAGTLGANSTSLTATFSESVIGGNLPASYQLQRAGADGLLGTADDSLITVTSATVSKNTATLNFAGLVEDVYRLTVKATITDAAGNLIDGDSNGSAGGNWSRDFVVGLPNDSTRRTLLPPRLGQAGADFGYSVAVDGNYRVVGAPYVDFNGVTDVGMAYVYEATTGVLITTLANPTPAANDAFGLSVAISGNMVVVGAYRDDTSATDSGSAYVFNATTGALIATLANPTPAADDNFAFGVAISGTTAVVGSYADDTTGTDSGSAYVFNATTGAYIRTVANPTPAAGDRFGLNAGVSGNTIVVGAYQDDTGGTNSGSAYVFNATTGAHVTTLGNPTPGADENFGYSLAVSGNTVVVGAYQESTTASKAGSAYVFNVTTGALITALANPTPAPDDNFGFSNK